MIRYCSQRLIRFMLTCLLAWTLAFLALRLIPGDTIAAQLAGSAVSPTQLAERRAAFGLDRPVLIQWIDSLIGLLHGDLGLSLSSSRPVRQIITEQWGATIELAVTAFLISLGIGIGCGVWSAAGSSGFTRWIASLISVMALSSPIYWIGVLAIYFLVYGCMFCHPHRVVATCAG